MAEKAPKGTTANKTAKDPSKHHAETLAAKAAKKK